MYDLSLHLLDLIENATRAGASAVRLTVAESPKEDTLTIVLEDDGPGLAVAPDAATDPFYTTKDGKRTGLGLSLFRAAVERAAGRLALRESTLGGLAVEATMQLSHVDRSPLGDVAATVSSVACTNPALDLECRFSTDSRHVRVCVRDVAQESQNGRVTAFELAHRVAERITSELTAIEFVAY